MLQKTKFNYLLILSLFLIAFGKIQFVSAQNDECSGAIAFPPILLDGSCSSVSFQSTEGASASNVTPSGACTADEGYADDDIWFSFVATSDRINIRIYYEFGSDPDFSWQVFSGSCAAQMTSIYCSYYNSGRTLNNLVIGDTFYIRIFTSSSNEHGVFSFCLSSDPTPVNDKCSDAITLIPNNDQSCTNVTSGTVYGATPSSSQLNYCSNGAEDDVWFRFTATDTLHSVTFPSLSDYDGIRTSIYQGSCNAMVDPFITCNEYENYGGLTIGATYYIRVSASYGGTFRQKTNFDLCIGVPAPLVPGPTPINDECTGAISIPVSPGIYCTAPTLGTIASATASGNSCINVRDNVWYSFVALATTQYIGISDDLNGNSSIYFAVYSGSCAAPGSELICTQDSYGTLNGLIIGHTYYLNVLSSVSSLGRNFTFNMCITSPAASPIPVNDECVNAIVLTASPNEICTNTVSSTILSATTSSQVSYCKGNPNDDVWFSFVATNTAHFVTLNNLEGSTSDLYHSIYEVPCDSMQFAKFCFDNNQSYLYGLTIGKTYYIRVYTYSNLPHTTKFDICVTGPEFPYPVNDECTNAIPVPVNTGTTCNLVTPGTVRGSSPSTYYNYCIGNYPENDVWFSFVATSPIHFIELSNYGGSGSYLSYSVIYADCDSVTQPVFCTSSYWDWQRKGVVTGLNVGTTYFLRISSDPWYLDNTLTFDICITQPVYVNLSQVPPAVMEDAGIPSQLIATLSDPLTVDATVYIRSAASSTASSGSDYTTPVSTIIIPAGMLSGSLNITPLADSEYEGDEQVFSEITHVEGGVMENGVQTQTLTIIEDDPKPLVSLSASSLTLNEVSASGITIGASLSKASTQDVTVKFQFTGSASNTMDYSAGTATLVIPAGLLSNITNINPINDLIYEGDENILISISSIIGDAEEDGTQELNINLIEDEPLPKVSISLASASVDESGAVVNITAAISGKTAKNCVVYLKYSGTASFGVDYVALTSLTISAGSFTKSGNFNPTTDAFIEGNESVIIEIDSVSLGEIDPLQSIDSLQITEVLGLEEKFTNKETIRIFPNPTNGSFTIEMDQDYPQLTIKITDLQGRIIRQEEIADQQIKTGTIHEASGIYFIHLLSQNKEIGVVRLIKE